MGDFMTIILNGTTGITTPAITDVSTGNVTYTGNLTGGTGVVNLGSGQLVKDTSGNLGLGVTPSAWGTSVSNRALDVGSYAAFGAWGGATVTTFNAYFNASNTATYKLTGVAPAMYLQGTSGHSWLNAPSGTVGAAIAFTQAMTLDTSGNLGVGSTTSGERLRLYVTPVATSEIAVFANDYTAGTARTALRMGFSGFGYGARIVSEGNPSLTNSNSLTFERGIGAPGYAESGRFDASGNLLVGATAQFNFGKQCIAFNGSSYYGLSLKDTVDQSAARFIGFINGSGTAIGGIDRVLATNAVQYLTSSDYRLKTVIGPVSDAGQRIDSLKPIDYLWKEGNSQARGFLAHEFKEVYANSVSGEKDAVDEDGKPKYQAMQASSSEVIADLVAEIQSLRKRLTALENK